MKISHLNLTASLSLGLMLLTGSASAFTIDVYQSGQSIYNMERALETIDEQYLLTSTEADVINLYDGSGGDGHFDEGQTSFPGGVHSDFVVHATGMITIDEAGIYSFGAEHDDGVSVSINDVQIINYPYLTDNRDTFGSVALDAGSHSVSLIFYEHLGGGSIEFFYQQGSHNSFNSGFELVQSSATSVPLSPTWSLLGLGFVGILMRRRAKRIAN